MEQCGTGPRILNSLRSDIQKGVMSEERKEYWVNKIDDVGKGRVGQRLSSELFKLQIKKEIPEYIQKAFDYLIKILDTTQAKVEQENNGSKVQDKVQ